ncbi:carboxylesterase family protein [Streptomyces mirabilis]|uniref:carboxylesterase family protein n=1 Tax=Streptomyces mirabilis TaxID=68239 RepID=UPI0036DB01DA
MQTDELFRNGALQVADHHGADGNATYVYQFDYHPAQDPGRLGAAHCVELPFLFGTFDSYPYCPTLGTPSDTERALGRSFATASSHSSPPAPRATGFRTRLRPPQESDTSAEGKQP